MKFKSEKNWLFGLVIWGIVLLLIIPIVIELVKYRTLFHGGWVVSLLAAAFFLWLWFGTWYLISDDKLYYRCGPIRGFLKISDIHTLIVNKTLWNGIKPALATRGIIIKYGRYDELYVSPRDKDGFIEQVRKANSEINVIANEG